MKPIKFQINVNKFERVKSIKGIYSAYATYTDKHGNIQQAYEALYDPLDSSTGFLYIHKSETEVATNGYVRHYSGYFRYYISEGDIRKDNVCFYTKGLYNPF